jgi:Putative zinc-finger
MTCDDVRISLGVYVLGALDADETAEVEAHLDGCPGCLAELAELSGLPPILDRVSPEDIEHVSTPPHAVLDRLIAASARRNRRSRVLLALAASVVVAALGGTAWLTAAQNGQGGVIAQDGVPTAAAPRPPVPSAPDAAARNNIMDAPAQPGAVGKQRQEPALSAQSGSVRMEVRLATETGGTRVRAEISGVPVGTVCTLRAVGRDGTVTPVASWSVGPDTYGREGKTSFQGSTALQAGQIQRFELGTQDGRTLVTVPV